MLTTAHEPDALTMPRRLTPAQQVRLLLLAAAAVVVALCAGVVLADVLFPEPTIWRLPIMAGLLAAAGLAVHQRVRRVQPAA